MKIEVDTHTHTVLSGHAFSTVLENAQAAKEAGMKGIVVTEHGPLMKNCPPEFHIDTLITVPDYLFGVRVYKGIEADILNDGDLDISPRYLKRLDYTIASLHDSVIELGTMQRNTDAMIAALNNPMIDCIGHPGNPIFPIDQPAVVNEAARLNKILEVNNHSFEYRTGSLSTCSALVRLCGEHGVRMAVSSDAHFCQVIGHYDYAFKVLEEMRFPESLIVNLTLERFEAYLVERKERTAALA